MPCYYVRYSEKIKINQSIMTMNGFFLLLPFLTIRFLLPFILNPKALARGAYFAPVQGREKAAYYIYQISNIAMFIYLLFLNVLIENSWQFYTGIVSYIVGVGLCWAATVNFSFPD